MSARAFTQAATTGRGVVIVAHSLGTSGPAGRYRAVAAAAGLVLWGVFAGLRRHVARHGALQALLIPDRWDNMAELPAVHVPVLILRGDRDIVVPAAGTEALVRVGDSNVGIISVPGASHNALYDPAAEADWQPILAFAAAAGAPRP